MKERGTSSSSSPGHFHHYRDEESGAAPPYGAEEVDDTFDIPPPKKAPLERLRKWRVSMAARFSVPWFVTFVVCGCSFWGFGGFGGSGEGMWVSGRWHCLILSAMIFS